MKNITLTIAAVALIAAFAGCTGAQSTENTTTANALNAAQNMSIDDVLQKSAELRQQIQDAKAAYNTAQQVDQATNISGTVTDGVKTAVKEKVDTVKKQLKDEKNAWKEALK